MNCKGLHCPGCGHGGGGWAVLVVLAAIILAAAARPVVHAAEVVAEVALITAASITGLALIGGMAYVALRVHRWQARRRQAIPRQGATVQAVSGPHRRAIEAPSVLPGEILQRQEEWQQRHI